MVEIDLGVAQHEAAHVVVGVALGLRLRRAAATPDPDFPGWLGYTWFAARRADRVAWQITLAAGVAWELAVSGGVEGAAGDVAHLRRLGMRGRNLEALVRAAAGMLGGLAVAHARTTRALLERGITHEDVIAIARGERIVEHDD